MGPEASGLVFGPVCSHRLGLSLGLDLLGSKVCSFDCLYCEVGPTRKLTVERRPYVSASQVLAGLESFLAGGHPAFEVVTLGGMGEPTLNSHMAEIIEGVRQLAPGVPVAVLTNSSLMSDAAVRRELCLADIVLPSLDSLVQREFLELNRPRPGLDLADISQGLLKFREEFSGRLRLEVLLCAGINDTRENLSRLSEFCLKLRPDQVDVVSLSRPGAYAQALPAGQEALELFRQELATLGTLAEKGGGGDKVSPTLDNGVSHGLQGLEGLVLRSLTRRPQTAGQLSKALGAPESEVLGALSQLSAEGRVSARQDHDGFFYFAGSGAGL